MVDPKLFVAVAVALLLFGACGSAADDGSPASGSPKVASSECPSAPTEVPEGSLYPMWPMEGAEDLVPDLEGMCETPTSPYLFGVLQEEAVWSGPAQAALGVAHSDGEASATFSVLRFSEMPAETEKARVDMGAVKVGDISLLWAGGGSHLLASWIDGDDLITVTGDESELPGVVEKWLAAEGHEAEVAPPDDVQEVDELTQPFLEGVPTEKLPEGYVALAFDPLMFMGSDFGDALTIHDEDEIEALGAAVVVTDENKLVGTVVASVGAGPGLSDWAEEFGSEASDAAAAGLASGDMGAFIVGDDQELLDSFMTEWKNSLD